MKKLLVLSLLVFCAGTPAWAAGLTATPPPKNENGHPDRASTPRTGGDTIEQATVITEFPFSDTGATCGYQDDYDEDCPYEGMLAPDVVYSYTPATAMNVMIDLCSSQYDTKVYVYAGGYTPGNPYACNDDANCGYSGYQSRLSNVQLFPGVTYYIVVDGYYDSCGTYRLELSAPYDPCPLVCPEGGLQEGEPDCHDGYVDVYNPGCSGGSGGAWTPIRAQANGCAVMCGKSGTYHTDGLNYRDEDWYLAESLGGPVTVDCRAEFLLTIWLTMGIDCENLTYLISGANACETVTVGWSFPAGTQFGIMVAPDFYPDTPCGSDYLMNVCGIAGLPPVPVEHRTWGGIKNLYHR
jgi:hypothetical protein